MRSSNYMLQHGNNDAEGEMTQTRKRKRKQKLTVIAKGKRTWREWAAYITESWSAVRDGAVAGFIETGKRLSAAKDELEHGEWLKLIGDKHEAGELPFQKRVAQKLMAIANCPAFQKRHIVTLLPPDYATIYGLQTLHRRFPAVFDEWIDDRRITPSLQRNEINKVLRLERVAEDESRILALRPKPGKYRTLVIDPAWEYDWLSLAGRAKPGYAMQPLDQLRELDLKQWADEEVGCQLYCWVTNNFMYEGGKLVERWGFQHRTLITWIKPPPFGLGSYFRNSTEHVLFATLGKTTTRHPAASIPTHFEAPRGEHSEKPEKFYDIVRASSFPPYGEGNQREPRPDFTNLFESVPHVAAAE